SGLGERGRGHVLERQRDGRGGATVFKDFASVVQAVGRRRHRSLLLQVPRRPVPGGGAAPRGLADDSENRRSGSRGGRGRGRPPPLLLLLLPLRGCRPSPAARCWSPAGGGKFPGPAG